MELWRKGTLAQRGAFLIGIWFVALGVIGLIVNPDFGTGADTTAKQWLVDWNGWHAASTVALGATALVAATRAAWALGFQAYNAVVNSVTAVWAIVDKTPAGVFDFPNATTDITLHFLTSAISAAILIAQLRKEKGPARTPGPIPEAET